MKRLVVLAICLAVGAAPAIAQSQPVAITPGKAVKHDHSGLSLPPRLGSLPLVQASDLAQHQLDRSFHYQNGDVSEALSIYIFRNVAGGPAVWMDRAQAFVEARKDYVSPRLHRLTNFTPPGQGTASGLIVAYASGGQYRSTGVAILPFGDFYVKLRASSATLDAPQLEDRMVAVLKELKWPRKMAPAPVAQPVQPCADALAFTGRSVAVKDEGAAVLANAFLGMIVAQPPKGKRTAAPQSVIWCRDSVRAQRGAVYRANGAKDRYLLALNDAGRGVDVGPNEGARLLADQKGNAPVSYSIALADMERTFNFPSQDRMPLPDQVAEIIAGPRVSAVSTWGKNKAINLSSDALKE